jgi:hypothetical protein
LRIWSAAIRETFGLLLGRNDLSAPHPAMFGRTKPALHLPEKTPSTGIPRAQMPMARVSNIAVVST